MFSLLRWAFVLLLCLGGIGLYRGWFSLSSPTNDMENNKVNISVSVDNNKQKDDLGKAEKKVAEEVDELTAKKKLELSFDGPFAPDQKLIENNVDNRWATVKDLYFDSTFRCLGINYQFGNKKEPSQQVHIVVKASATNARTYTLLDDMRTDARLTCMKPKLVGSVMMWRGSVNTESLSLPIKQSDIAKINVCLSMDD